MHVEASVIIERLPLVETGRERQAEGVQAEILLFDGFEELDVFGPLGVLAGAGFAVSLVTREGARPVTSAHGSVTAATRELGTAPELLVVPGGGWAAREEHGAWAEARRSVLPRTVAERFAAGSTLAAVSTGAMLVAGAGLLRGRPAVTHHAALDELAAAGAQVVRHARVVDDGRLLTAGGVTAGIDLALWLVERELGPDAAAAQASRLEHPRIGTVWRRPSAGAPSAAGDEGSALALPETALARAARDLAAATESPALYNHSVRSYLFARLAPPEGMLAGRDFDDELVFLGCVLHDVGLTEYADRGARFEVDGAEAAVTLLRANGLNADRADVVWQAIALHTSPGIAERRAPEVALTRRGIGMDFGRSADLVPEVTAAAVHQRYPRIGMARCLTEAIVEQARGRPGKAPRYSLPGELVRERAAGGETELERQAREGRWGE